MHAEYSELEYLNNYFHGTESHDSSVWKKRIYAPMCIHRPELAHLKKSIEETYPDYVVTFDVLFSSDAPVAWHIDHESLGPFYHNYSDIWKAHFLTLHMNICCESGGSLRTLPWPVLSALYMFVNRTFDIFSRPHLLLAQLTSLLSVFAKKHSPEVGKINAFNNLQLHLVDVSVQRISYAIRLVRRDKIQISPLKIKAALPIFQIFLPVVSKLAFASSVHWEAI